MQSIHHCLPLHYRYTKHGFQVLFGRSLVLFVKRHLEIVLLIVGEVVTIPSKAKTLLICANVYLPSHWVQRATILPL